MKKIITFSRMDAFGCPYHFFKEGYAVKGKINPKNDQDIGRGKPVTQPPEFGSGIHLFNKLFINSKCDDKEIDRLETVQKTFKKYKIVSSRFAEYREICENSILNMEKHVNFDDVLEVEETWEIDLGHNGWILRLTPDLVLNMKDMMAILDHKSDMYKRTTSELDEDFQTSVYAFALHKKYGIMKVLILMHFCRYRGFVRSIREGERFFQDIELTIKNYCDRIDECLKTNEWERMVSGACKYCDERVLCLASKVDGFSNFEDDKILRFAGQFKKIAKQLEEQAKDRMAKRDPIEINGKLCGFIKKEGKTPEVDKDRAIEIFEKNHVAWKHLCSLSNTNIKKIMEKSDPEIQGLINKISEVPIKSSLQLP